jgi:hypothetical protein
MVQAAVQRAAEGGAGLAAELPAATRPTGETVHVECRILLQTNQRTEAGELPGLLFLVPVPAPSPSSFPLDRPSQVLLTWTGEPGVSLRFDPVEVRPEALTRSTVHLPFSLRLQGPRPSSWAFAVRCPDAAALVSAPVTADEGTTALTDRPIVTLDATLRGDFATLHIYSPGPGLLRFSGDYQRTRRWEQTVDVTGASVELGEEARPVVDAMASLADRVVELLEWLGEVAEASSEACLVLVDHTDLGIPWEMLEIDEGEPLGALLSVVRWAMVNRRRAIRLLDPGEDQRAAGSVLAYFDARLLETAPERKALGKVSYEELLEFQKLGETLKKPPEGHGLILLACHATYSGKDGKSSISDPSKKQPALEPSHLVRMTVREEAPRPLVLVNACNSARVARGVDGFPRIFLSRLAVGYIGTLGYVDSKLASAVSEALILAAGESGDDGVRVTDVLRGLRAAAAARLRKAPHEVAAIRQYVTTFLFVFYGSHNTYLRLLPRKAP